jgi:lysozyme family protein
MTDFAKALAYTLKWEGGWSDDPADPGGATNHGITLKTAQRYGIKTKEELRAISPERVAEIYEAGYWRFGDGEDQRVATKLFDMAVNMGPETAIRLLRKALGALPDTPTADGGPSGAGPARPTLDAANGVGPPLLLACLREVCAAHYRAIVARRPASAKFLKGWLRRAAEVPNE